MVKFPMTDVRFPLLSCTTHPVSIEHAVYQGCVNRAIAYTISILCAEDTNTAREDGGFGVVPRMQSPIPLFFIFALHETSYWPLETW